ncbi:MAG: hypothetical protein SGJ20_13000 [Planctomycetota bacterium]|nr:hypothetical protein [Planctomycetota bacterium]
MLETIDASRIETGFMGHSYYGSNRAALSYLFALIKENRGAADRPWLRMESATADAGYNSDSVVNSWWIFNSQPAEIRWVWYFDRLKQMTANGPADTTFRN